MNELDSLKEKLANLKEILKTYSFILKTYNSTDKVNSKYIEALTWAVEVCSKDVSSKEAIKNRYEW